MKTYEVEIIGHSFVPGSYIEKHQIVPDIEKPKRPSPRKTEYELSFPISMNDLTNSMNYH